MFIPSTILVIGPTGAGKSPLGDYLQSKGLKGKRCLHLDFGSQLRTTAKKPAYFSELSSSDINVIKKSLASGKLLENKNFKIAEKILQGFLKRNVVKSDEYLVLNGLPRHCGQAEDLQRKVKIKTVVVLNCNPDTIYKRLRLNSGGDRTERTDDSLELVRSKLEVYNKRTIPLLDFYQQEKSRILEFDIQPETQPQEIFKKLTLSYKKIGNRF